MGIVNYRLEKNFLSKEELKVYGQYAEFFHRNNFKHFDTAQSLIMDSAVYADSLMESILLCKKEKLEKIVGEELLPTYSFLRVYTKGAELTKHTDRPSCEISVTLNLKDSGEDWALYFAGTPVVTKPGDAIIYKGIEVEHWREKFTGDFQAQVFLHYVRKEGKYNAFHKDMRRYFATKKV
jgi:hypothetical protein